MFILKEEMGFFSNYAILRLLIVVYAVNELTWWNL